MRNNFIQDNRSFNMLQVWKHEKSGQTHKVEDRQADKHPEFVEKLKRDGFVLMNPPKKKVAKKKKASKKK